jgi:hypothetical protein
MTPNFPKFDETKVHWISGRTLNKLLREIKRMAPIAGAGLREESTDLGTVLHALQEDRTGIPTPEGYDAGGTGGEPVTRYTGLVTIPIQGGEIRLNFVNGILEWADGF